MKILIRPKSSEPIYVQIYDAIVASIASGELSPGDVLPSSRVLAKDLHVNYLTVNKSYALLVSEGFVKSENKRVEVLNPTESSRKDFIKRWRNTEQLMIREAMAKKITRKEMADLLKEILNSLQ